MSAADAPASSVGATTPDADLVAEVRAFLALEARLADNHLLAEWFALWADQEDVLYWVPAGEGDPTEGMHVAVIRDGRTQLDYRIRRLMTGLVHTQEPPSNLSRLFGEPQIRELADGLVEVRANYHVAEARIGYLNWWVGEWTFRLRRRPGAGFAIVEKVVCLATRNDPLRPLSFIL
jgi:3-phenylpropionate/cinnamic acid dioxygenase small subunit